MSRLANAVVVFGLLLSSAGAVLSETPEPLASAPAVNTLATTSDSQISGRWEYGPFAVGGTGVGDRSDYQFFSLGFQAGRVLTPLIHAGPLSGRFELGANVMPLWQAYTPAPHTEVVTAGGETSTVKVDGGTYTGISVTPVIFRWNFANKSQRFMPWFQAAGGFIYTTRKFPGTIEVPKGTPGGTSVYNFSPQGGVGFHYFLRPKRSLDFGLNAEHISSASLGDRNPGVNASLQFQLGYTWWK